MNRTLNHNRSKMSNDAFAGFLKLWLTPASQIPARSAETDAYLQYLSKVGSAGCDCPGLKTGMIEEDTDLDFTVALDWAA
jgi:hypothetical protein